ncbi:histidine kinase N-terminal 7TM domain-containing protein [Acetivibrio cellulolyticus]
MKIGIDYFFVILTLFFVIYFIYRIIDTKHKTAVHLTFLSFLAALALWFSGDILYYFYSYNPLCQYIFNNIRYMGIILVPPSFFMTAYSFLNKDFKFHLLHLSILAIPLISIIILWTNPIHQLMFVHNSSISTDAQYGEYFYLHTLYSYLLLVLAYIIFIYSSIKDSGVLSKQSMLIFLGCFVPFVTNILITFKLISVNINYTLITMGITMICYWVAIFKYGYLNIMPLAIKMMMDNIQEAFVAMDYKMFIIENNTAFNICFLRPERLGQAHKLSLKDIFPSEGNADIDFSEFEQSIDKSIQEKAPVTIEKYFKSIDRHFDVEVSAIQAKNHHVGTIVIFKDITQLRKLLDTLQEKNEKLTFMNKQLSDYAATVRELVLRKERSRLETEIHNLMSHNLVVLLRLMEVCTITIETEPQKAVSVIKNAGDIIRNTMSDVRKIAREIAKSEEDLNMENSKFHPLSNIELLIGNFIKNSGLNVEYSFEGEFNELSQLQLNVLYNLCQEAMTNAVKHGKATSITILLRTQQNNIQLTILDDGRGCNVINNSGLGLKGMTDMVQNLYGSIEFKSEENDGFKIFVTMPMKECVA